MKQNFNPNEWAKKNMPNTEMPVKAKKESTPLKPEVNNISDVQEDILRVADELIARQIDVTYEYKDWLRLGFAIVDGMGEGGRQLFHDLSRICSKYDEAKCDEQFNNCLNARGSGVTVRTFFQMAKDAGVDISANPANMLHGKKYEKEGEKGILTSFDQNMTNGKMAKLAEKGNECIRNVYYDVTFSDKIMREDLPDMLHPIYDSQEGFVDKDKVLLGSITNIAGVIPQSVYGIYDGSC